MEKNDDKNIQLIDKHLTGTLSKEEAVLFDEKLKEADFKKLFLEMQQLKSGITTFELRQAKNILQEEELQIRSTQKKDAAPGKSVNLLSNFLKIAAILAGLAFGFWWVSSQPSDKPKDQKDYFAQYFSPAKNILFIHNRSLPISSQIEQIFTLYDNKAYQDFLKEIEPIISTSGNDDYRFYQANALLETNQTDAAINILKQIIQKNESQFIDNSKWLLALAYLRKEQWKEAREMLESITLPHFKSKAEAILQTLD